MKKIIKSIIDVYVIACVYSISLILILLLIFGGYVRVKINWDSFNIVEEYFLTNKTNK